MSTVYTSPTSDDVQRWTGVNRYLFGQQDPAFAVLLGEFLPLAEAATAQSVGVSLFQGALTDQQAILLRTAVANRVAARVLRRLDVEKVTGTMQPLLIDGERLEQVTASYETDAGNLESLAVSGEGVEVTNVVTNFDSETVSVFTKTGDLW